MDIVIRPPNLEDQGAFLAGVHASRELHAAWVLPPDTARLFATYVQRNQQDNQLCFLVCLEDTGEIAGVVNASEIVGGCLKSCCLGFYALAPHAGTGAMSLGLAAVITRLFEHECLHRVEANIQPANQRSLALVQRVGFRREGFSPRYLKIAGRWCDHERWALLGDEWSGVPAQESTRARTAAVTPRRPAR
jgi:ribosomal-protein-alanine N-acetyltransferase